jgi:hypothetical protein
MVGNVLGTADSLYCIDGVSYDSNYFISAGNNQGCGPNKIIGPVPYINGSDGSAGNYHLAGAKGSTGADNLVAQAIANSGLMVDKDGDPRPIDTKREAGADER